MTEENKTNQWDKNQPKTWMWAAILGIIVLLICGVSSLVYSVNHYFTGWKKENDELATQVAKDKLVIQYDLATQAAAMATAAVADQVGIRDQAARWPMAMMDTFDENINEWWIDDVDDEYTNMTITINGRYVWDAIAKQGFIWRVWPDNEFSSDFYLAIDAQNLTMTPDSYYGLIFRNNDGRYYFFEVWDSQNYRALYNNGNEWEILIPYTFSSTIRPGEINHLEVVSKDNVFYFFINKQYIDQAKGNTPSEGQVGVAIGLSNAGDEVTIAFDNFELRVP